jgi:hypothetical protein
MVKLGIPIDLIHWIASYLSGRSLYVQLGDTSSTKMAQTRGIPQGSALGPLLFNVFFHDAPGCVGPGAVMTCFADDALIVVAARTTADVHSRITEELRSFNEYCCTNSLCLNKTKTKWMLAFAKDQDSPPDVHIDGSLIERVEVFKYLGVMLDSSFSWQCQVDAVISRVKRTMYVLHRSRYYASRRCAMLLFHSLIMPTFTYSIEVWYCTGVIARGSLELALRHCGRIILGDTGPMPAISNKLVYELLDVMPLHFLFQYRASCLIFNLLSCSSNISIRNLLKANVVPTARMLRVHLPLIEIYVRLERTRAAITYWGPKLWNSLKSYIRESRTLDEFKQRYTLDSAYTRASTPGHAELPHHFYDFV